MLLSGKESRSEPESDLQNQTASSQLWIKEGSRPSERCWICFKFIQLWLQWVWSSRYEAALDKPVETAAVARVFLTDMGQSWKVWRQQSRLFSVSLVVTLIDPCTVKEMNPFLPSLAHFLLHSDRFMNQNVSEARINKTSVNKTGEKIIFILNLVSFGHFLLAKKTNSFEGCQMCVKTTNPDILDKLHLVHPENTTQAELIIPASQRVTSGCKQLRRHAGNERKD